MSERLPDFYADAGADESPEQVRPKYAAYRLTREVYQRLLEKYQSGQKINFKERGSDHLFTDATGKPTGEDFSRKCGAGFYIIEHLFNGTALDWSFAVVEPRAPSVVAADYSRPHNPQYGYAPRSPQSSRDNYRPARRERLPRHMRRGREPDSRDQLIMQMVEREREVARERIEREREFAQREQQLQRESFEARMQRLEQQLQDKNAAQPTLDDETLFAQQLLKNSGAAKSAIRQVTDALGDFTRPDEPEGWGDKALGFLESTASYWMPYVAPVVAVPLGKIVNAAAAKQGGDAATPTPAPASDRAHLRPVESNGTRSQFAAQPQGNGHAPPTTTTVTESAEDAAPLSEETQESFVALLGVVLRDMADNAPAARSVDAVTSLLDNHPAARVVVEPLLLSAPETVLASLTQIGAQGGREDVGIVCALPHARAFIESLQADIAARKAQAS